MPRPLSQSFNIDRRKYILTLTKIQEIASIISLSCTKISQCYTHDVISQITEKKLVGPSMSEICCLDGQVYDNGNCADTCPIERSMNNGGVCGCAADKNDFGGGLCCSIGKFNYNGECAITCPLDTVLNEDTDTCECPPGKANLNGICCANGKKMFDSQCVDSCPPDTEEFEGLCRK